MAEFVHESFLARAEQAPQRLALVAGERRLTYGSLRQHCLEVANAFRERGLERGDRVAIRLENGVESAVSILATAMAGGVIVVLSPRLPRERFERILRDCAPRLLVTEERFGTPPPDLVGSNVFVSASASGDPAPRFRDLRSHAFSSSLGVQADDLCYIAYTSGSSGEPKGVMMEHGAAAFVARSITEYLGNRPDEVVFDPLPLSFDYGLHNLWMPLRIGGTVVLEPSTSHPFQWISTLRREEVTGLPLLPSTLAMLLELEPRRLDLPSLRYATTTGQHLPRKHVLAFLERHPRVRLFTMYGLTECKRALYLPPERLADKPDSVGIAIPGTKAWRIDARGERVSRPDEIGELVVEGPHVMRGYWNDPEGTRAIVESTAIPGVRRLRTGDLFSQDEEGFFSFRERRDSLLKVGGVRVSPREVERILLRLEAVREVSAFGVPHPILGTVVHAVVSCAPDAGLTVEDLRAFARRHLETAWVPRSFELRERLPTTVNGKTDHERLRAEEGSP